MEKPEKAKDTTHTIFERWRAKAAKRLQPLRERIQRSTVASTIFTSFFGVLQKNIVGIAAQTAFFLLLAIFPLTLLLGSFLSDLQLEIDPGVLEYIFPNFILQIIKTIQGEAQLSTGMTIFSIVLSLWSASAGVWALMRGVCLSYTGRTPRWINGRIRSLILMVLFVLALALQIFLWLFGSNIIQQLTTQSGTAVWLLDIGRYLAAFLLIFGLALALYALTPGFSGTRRSITAGAAVAALGWELSSWGFEVYIDCFQNYSVVYGSVGAILGLAIWLLVISMVILIGAEINALLVNISKKKQVAQANAQSPQSTEQIIQKERPPQLR